MVGLGNLWVGLVGSGFVWVVFWSGSSLVWFGLALTSFGLTSSVSLA